MCIQNLYFNLHTAVPRRKTEAQRRALLLPGGGRNRWNIDLLSLIQALPSSKLVLQLLGLHPLFLRGLPLPTPNSLLAVEKPVQTDLSHIPWLFSSLQEPRHP